MRPGGLEPAPRLFVAECRTCRVGITAPVETLLGWVRAHVRDAKVEEIELRLGPEGDAWTGEVLLGRHLEGFVLRRGEHEIEAAPVPRGSQAALPGLEGFERSSGRH